MNPLTLIFRLLYGLSLVATGLTGSVATAQPQSFEPARSVVDAGFSTDRLARLSTLLQSFVDNGIAPNAVAFVAWRGQIIHYQAYGYRNREQNIPLQRDDLFRLASQTKAITTVALMTLFEEGKFLLDERISTYIPAFKNPRVLVSYNKETGEYTTRPATREITIRQLLAHNAGIAYEHPLDQLPQFRVPLFCSTGSDTLKTIIDRLARRPLTTDPGDGFVYGYSTDILGRLVEILSGERLDAAIQKRVLTPLGMNDTHFYLPTSKTNRLVELYSKSSRDKPLTLSDNELYRAYPVAGARTYFSGGGGLVGTIADYARFCQMLLNGGRFNNRQILSRKTIEMMLQNQLGGSTVWDRQDKFGLGFQLITEPSHYGDQATPGSYTWGGMFCSEYTIDPTENLIMLVFTSVYPYAHYSEFVRKFRISVYQTLH